jgi:hypothetical protein
MITAGESFGLTQLFLWNKKMGYLNERHPIFYDICEDDAKNYIPIFLEAFE